MEPLQAAITDLIALYVDDKTNCGKDLAIKTVLVNDYGSERITPENTFEIAKKALESFK